MRIKIINNQRKTKERKKEKKMKTKKYDGCNKALHCISISVCNKNHSQRSILKNFVIDKSNLGLLCSNVSTSMYEGDLYNFFEPCNYA